MNMISNNNDGAVSCKRAYEDMNEMLSSLKMIRNFNRRIHIGNEEQFTIETDLFPVNAMKVYSAWNLEEDISEEDKAKYFSAHRGGSQGDYRNGMKRKIQNVVDCLQKFPQSKRAVITIPNNSHHAHECDDDSKCMREIHFYYNEEQDRLDATVWMRAQVSRLFKFCNNWVNDKTKCTFTTIYKAAEIFPKNIHFIGSLMLRIADQLSDSNRKVLPGELFYLATTLVSVRED